MKMKLVQLIITGSTVFLISCNTGNDEVLEKKLNEINVYSYEQLAKLNSTNIKTLEESIGDFIGRIERDKWVSQSKELFKK